MLLPDDVFDVATERLWMTLLNVAVFSVGSKGGGSMQT